MRVAYLIGGFVVTVLVLINEPRIPWVHVEEGGPVGPLRGLVHGMVGFSYEVTWLLIIGGAYQILLGIVYWDMDTAEAERWQFTLESGGTARLLWITGAVCLLLGLAYATFIYTHDRYLWPAGVASTATAWLSAWFYWLAFPLMEQVGMDREQFGV